MMKKRETRGFSNFGFSTILLSFVMICVVTFSALSLVTANSDYKLSKKVADKTQSYYVAQEAVYDKLFVINQELIDDYRSSASDVNYYEKAEASLAEHGTWEVTDNGYYLSLRETISEDQYLTVTLSIQYPMEDADTFYEIIEWKSVYEKEPPEDETLDLFQ